MKKKWGKKQFFVIDASPYNKQIGVVVNGQFSDYTKFLRKQKSIGAKENLKEIESDKDAYKDRHIPNTRTGTTYTGLPNGYVMVISHQDSWVETVKLVSHETLHVTHYILKDAGITLCRESEEAYTYLQADILGQILYKMY